MMSLLQEEFAAARVITYGYTVEQYHHMLEHGIIEDGAPYELLDGVLVRTDRSAAGANPITIGLDHAYIASAIEELNAALRAKGCYARIQQPITLLPVDEPEPDAVIVKGTKASYAARHPGPGDILCIVEVADSSYQRDSTTKLKLYARAGVGLYCIVNVRARQVECYRRPSRRAGKYAEKQVVGLKDVLTLPTARGECVEVKVGDLFPPRNGRNGR